MKHAVLWWWYFNSSRNYNERARYYHDFCQLYTNGPTTMNPKNVSTTVHPVSVSRVISSYVSSTQHGCYFGILPWAMRLHTHHGLSSSAASVLRYYYSVSMCNTLSLLSYRCQDLTVYWLSFFLLSSTPGLETVCNVNNFWISSNKAIFCNLLSFLRILVS